MLNVAANYSKPTLALAVSLPEKFQGKDSRDMEKMRNGWKILRFQLWKL